MDVMLSLGSFTLTKKGWKQDKSPNDFCNILF